MREVQRRLDVQTQALAAGGEPEGAPSDPKALSDLQMWLARAERIRTQQRHDKNKLYALHAPEVECIGKGKARKPYEFGVKVSLAVTHKQGLMVGARSFPGNPYDGHILAAQMEQTSNLLQDLGRSPTQAIVDLGFRGVDADNPGVEIIHRGRYKSLTSQHKRWLKRRQAIEPMIGHTKSDNRMDRCWLQGALGDALHALSCAAGYNIRWLLRAIARLASMQERLVREQIVEAVRLADIAKAPIASSWTLDHALPLDNAGTGLPVAVKIVSNHVKSLTVEGGAIHLTFGNRAIAAISGKTLTLRPAIVEYAPVVPVA